MITAARELGGRRAAGGEDLAHSVAAGEVLREIVAAAHSAQVHDATQTGGVGGIADVLGRDRLRRSEVAPCPDRVDEVVRRLAALECRREGVRLEHVTGERLHVVGPLVALGSARRTCEHPHPIARLEQLRHETAADVTGGAEHEHVAAALVGHDQVPQNVW